MRFCDKEKLKLLCLSLFSGICGFTLRKKRALVVNKVQKENQKKLFYKRIFTCVYKKKRDKRGRLSVLVDIRNKNVIILFSWGKYNRLLYSLCVCLLVHFFFPFFPLNSMM